jgi:hypothetical protein
MAEVLPLPSLGDVFADVRTDERGMRVSYHRDADVLVVSLWSGRTCRATFQLAGAEVARLSALLTEVIGAADRSSQPEPATAPDATEPEGGPPGPVALAS